MKKYVLVALLIVLGTSSKVFAQFEVGGHLIQRAEVRNGSGTLIPDNQGPAAFVGQRARITADYAKDSLKFHVSIQDVRVWGSAPQLKSSDGYLSVYEAYAETTLGNNFSIKLGRQELSYDNQRFLGSVNWALQGRSHDFGLLKYENGDAKFHFGAGFNQDSQKTSGTTFTTANQYKMANLIHFSNKYDKLTYAVMAWTEGRQSLVGAPAVVGGTTFSSTIGVPTLSYKVGKSTSLGGYYYHQIGKDLNAKKLNAFDVSLSIDHKMVLDEEKGKVIKVTLGGELLSGTATGSAENNSFNPMYGTNHAHNGHMDFFYVGKNGNRSLGLKDIFVKAKINTNKKFFVEGDIHMFSTDKNIVTGLGQDYGKNLGVELDFFAGYNYSKQIFVKAGYSHMIASDGFEYLQPAVLPAATQNWAYAMIVYKPAKK